MLSETLKDQIEKAFDYRGDVTIYLKNGVQKEGFLFNRVFDATASESFIEYFPSDESPAERIKMDDVDQVVLTGEDCAAGKSYEEWLAKQNAKKNAAG